MKQTILIVMKDERTTNINRLWVNSMHRSIFKEVVCVKKTREFIPFENKMGRRGLQRTKTIDPRKRGEILIVSIF